MFKRIRVIGQALWRPDVTQITTDRYHITISASFEDKYVTVIIFNKETGAYAYQSGDGPTREALRSGISYLWQRPLVTRKRDRIEDNEHF